MKLTSLFKKENDHILSQLFRYTFVGGFAFIVDFSALYVFTEFLHVHYLISAAIGFILGLLVNYALSIIWVFNKRTVKSRLAEATLFAVIGLIGLGLNELFIWFFTEQSHLHYQVSKVISTAIIYFWNFFARKLALFK